MKHPVRPNRIWVLLAMAAWLSAGVAFPAAGALIAPAERALPAPGAVVLENFEGYENDGFPEKWRAMKEEARTIYHIEAENGNRFLRARADQKTVQIGLEHPIDPKQHTHLTWRWRAREFPAGADERVADKYDSAAQVYVIFDSLLWPRFIKYVWSETLPVGARFTHPLYSRARVVVMESGSGEKDRWFDEKINFYDDYKRFFGSEPGKVQGIAILSSSEVTKSLSVADYDDFVLLP